MIAAVALTLVLPVAGLIVSLAADHPARAADRARARWPCAGRCAGRGPATCWWWWSAPLAVARALLTEALMAPLAFAVAAVVYVVTLDHAQPGHCRRPVPTPPRPSWPGTASAPAPASRGGS